MSKPKKTNQMHYTEENNSARSVVQDVGDHGSRQLPLRSIVIIFEMYKLKQTKFIIVKLTNN